MTVKSKTKKSKSKYCRSSWLLTMLMMLVTHQEDHEQYVGDIEELYHINKEKKGRIKANLYLMGQIVRSLPYFLFTSFYWGAMMFRNYFKIALRTLTKRKGYSFINVSGLAIGIACALFILGYVENELSYDKFLENSDDLYVLTFDQNGSTTTPTALAEYLKTEYPEVVNASRFIPMGRDYLKYGGVSAFQNGGAVVDDDFLSMYSIELLKGDLKTALEDPHAILISETVAQKYFGSKNPIGKTINMNNESDLMVRGVFKDYPENSHIECTFILSTKLLADRGWDMNTWDWNNVRTYVQLDPKSNVEGLNTKLAQIYTKRESNEKRKLFVQSITQWHLDPYLDDDGTITYIYMFSTLAFLILLIACINFINLTTAKSSVRAKEVGIRKTIGAYKGQLVKQFFSESLILTLVSFGFALCLVALFLPLFNELTSKTFSFSFVFQGNMMAGVFGILILTGILSGTYPALLLSRFQPVKVLKGAAGIGKGNSFFRKVLVVAQFTTSISLILFSIVVYNQIHFLKNRDVGFDRGNLIYFQINGKFAEKYSSIRTSLLANPSIKNISLASSAPYQWDSNAGLENVSWEGQTSQKTRLVMTHVDMEFLNTIGLQMSEGRFFSADYPTDTTDAYVINEAAVRAMQMKEPIGKWVKAWGDKRKIIGVIKDYNYESLKSQVRPMALRVLPVWYNQACVRISPQNVLSTLEFIEQKWAEVNPELPFEYNFLDETLRSIYKSEETIGNIVSVFTFLAVAISCLGLFGLSSYTAEQKTKEIGIRKVLGASAFGIVQKLSKEFVLLIVLSFLIAWPLAYYAITRWLEAFPYREEISPWLFAGVLFFAVFLTVATISWQIIKAALADPVKSLKYE